MKYIRITARILLGLVFIFSGFVKGVDPVGWTIKFSEYTEAFHLSWLEPLGLTLSILLSTAEFLIGIMLLTGLRMKVTAWASLLFMGFFLVLTLYIAIFNPVTDCGCFGDALVITNWQTFYKNIFLMALAVFIFIYRDDFKKWQKAWKEWSMVGFFALVGIIISVYCMLHLPIMDFRPYKVGTHIPSQMIIPEGAEQPVYKTTLIYSKNGVDKEFTIENYPWKDTTWVFKDQKSVLISEGYKTPIHGFSISTINGEDITQSVLSDTAVSFVFIASEAEKADADSWLKLIDYYNFAQKNNLKFYILTGSTKEAIEKITLTYKLPFEFQLTDKTALKTVVRSNPGLMVLKDGIVLGLWHYNDFPTISYFNGNIESKLIIDYHRNIEWKRILLIFMGLGIVFVAMLGYRK